MHPLPFLNPTCSSVRTLSAADVIGCITILQNILMETKCNAPLVAAVPFLGTVTITPLVHSDGIFPSTQMSAYSQRCLQLVLDQL